MERRNAATAAVRRATEAYDTLRSKIIAAAAHVRERVDQLDHVRRSYASKVDPFTLRRLELRAAALREQGGAALLTEWREAEAQDVWRTEISDDSAADQRLHNRITALVRKGDLSAA